MSLPDHELDEPREPEWCELHETVRPCQHCKDTMADWTCEDREER